MLALPFFWISTALATCTVAEQVDVYPTAGTLPENLLRIYVYFPRAMSARENNQVVKLLDSTGAEIERVFLNNREDLWSPDRRRLTVYLNPGRVKTGLNAHKNLGRALVPSQSYTFEVSDQAIDSEGCQLGKVTRHNFTVVPADMDPPDPGKWKLKPPRAYSLEPLEIYLGSAHDHLSLAFRLRVLDDMDRVVPGRVELGPDEESWIFYPTVPWSHRAYALSIDKQLEDLAGNRPGVLFDRPVGSVTSVWKNRLGFTPD